PERNRLPDAYSEHLAAALRTSPDLTELALYRNALGNSGVQLLCLLSTSGDLLACQPPPLIKLYLTNNALGDAGVRLLCQGLRHPRCRLRVL
ncbi:Hypothetical predicted protein, partial [Marmota monax]